MCPGRACPSRYTCTPAAGSATRRAAPAASSRSASQRSSPVLAPARIRRRSRDSLTGSRNGRRTSPIQAYAAASPLSEDSAVSDRLRGGATSAATGPATAGALGWRPPAASS
jgi:hypothetical protein